MDLGTISVSFTADISQLTSNVQQAKDDIASVGQTSQDAGEQTSGGFMKSVKSIVDFGSKIGQTVIGVKGLYDGAVTLATGLLAPAARAEQVQNSFETLLHSTTAAKNEMVSLNTFASQTPMETQWIDEAAAKMLAFGFKTSQVQPDLKAIGDSLSGLGKLSEASLNSIVDIFGKISAQGKITGGDMMQLSDWGIPAWQMLSQAMGKPIPELQNMVSKGLIPASTALPALTQGMEKTFGGDMQRQATSFNGLVSTISSNFQIFMASLAGPAMKVAEQGMMGLATALSSPAFQQFATVAGQGIAAALTGLFTGISKVVSIGEQIVGFFQHSQIAADALLIPLGALAGAMTKLAVDAVVDFIASLPEIIAGFAAWATGAWAAAAGMIAATWPFLLVGAIVGAVIAGIVLAIQHWGQISAWLKGAWSDVVSFFQNMLKGIQLAFGIIGNWFHDRFSDAKNKVQSVWSGIGGWFHDRAKSITDGFNAANQDTIKGFQYLYAHNYYFKNLVDFARQQWKNLQVGAQYDWKIITGIVTNALDTLKSWVTGWWNDQVAGWTAAWHLVSGIVTSLWNDVKTGFTVSINFVWSLIKPFYDLFIAGWNMSWRIVSGIVRMLWLDVTGAFNAGISSVQGALSAVWSLISNGWSNLVNMASGWGRNIIQGIIDGITGMLGNLGNIASNAAGTIAKFLGFHSPAEAGPGAELDVWGPNMVKGFSTGIVQSIPLLENAMQQLTQSLAIPGISANVSASAALALPQGTSVTAPLQGVSQIMAATAAASTSNMQGTPQEIMLYLDSQLLGQAQGNTMMKQIRLRSGVKV